MINVSESRSGALLYLCINRSTVSCSRSLRFSLLLGIWSGVVRNSSPAFCLTPSPTFGCKSIAMGILRIFLSSHEEQNLGNDRANVLALSF